VLVVGLPLPPPLAPPLLPPSVVLLPALVVVPEPLEGLPDVVFDDPLDWPVVVVPLVPTVVITEPFPLEAFPPPLVFVPAELALLPLVSPPSGAGALSPPQWVNENKVPRQTQTRADVERRMGSP
jgi:hypothetical protein